MVRAKWYKPVHEKKYKPAAKHDGERNMLEVLRGQNPELKEEEFPYLRTNLKKGQCSLAAGNCIGNFQFPSMELNLQSSFITCIRGNLLVRAYECKSGWQRLQGQGLLAFLWGPSRFWEL